MTAPTPAQAVADAARAVEETWIRSLRGTYNGNAVIDYDAVCAVNSYLAARRLARAAGYVEVMVSKDAVEALRKWNLACQSVSGASVQQATAFGLFARDLAPMLNPNPKETP